METKIQETIDMALAIAKDARFSESQRIIAMCGWLQGRRKEILGEAADISALPSSHWLPYIGQ